MAFSLESFAMEMGRRGRVYHLSEQSRSDHGADERHLYTSKRLLLQPV